MDPSTHPEHHAREDTRSLGGLFRALAADGALLVRQELALARAELTRSLAALGADAGLVAAGAALAAVGLLVLVAALVAFVGDLLGGRHALAALIVGVVLTAAGGGVAWLGARRARSHRLAPREALAELRETGAWARAEAVGLRSALSADGARTADGRAGGATWTGAPRVHPLPRPARPASSTESSSSDKPADPGRERRTAGAAPLPATAPLWKRVLREFKADDVSNQAAKVAYYFFLSLPPAVMALFGVTGLVGGQDTGDWIAGRLFATLPGEAAGLVDDFVADVVHRNHPGALSVGLLLAVWGASNVFMALEDTLNDAWGVTRERSFVKRRLVTLGVLLAVGALMLVGSGVLLGGPAISRALGLGPAGDLAWSVAQWPLAFAVITGAFWITYYVLPNRDQRRCKGVLLRASAIAAGLWVLATLAFRVYISNFGSYGATYGLLGTVIVLLLWMYVTSLVILLGGEVASEMERTA